MFNTTGGESAAYPNKVRKPKKVPSFPQDEGKLSRKP
jgi:hypothetical protein